MKFYHLQTRSGWRLLLLLCLSLPSGISYLYAQQKGEGGLPGILRNKVPRAPNPPRAKPQPTPVPKPRPTPRVAPTNIPVRAPVRVAKPPVIRAPRNAEDRIENALDAANMDRDEQRFEKAEKGYLRVLKAKPREWRAAYGLGNVYADQQSWEKAEKYYTKATELNAKNAEIFIALGYILLQPRTRGNDATSLLKADRAARSALLLEKDNATANDLLGLALVQRGIISDEAEAAFRAAIAQEPKLAAPYIHLARLLSKKNRAEDADPLYRKAISLASEQDADTAILVASELQSEQRWEDSLPLLEYALSKDKDNPSALMLLGRAYSVAVRFEDAVSVLKTTISKVPKTFMPHYMLGTVYQRMKRINEAEAEFNDAFKYASDGEKCLLTGQYGFTGLGDAYTTDGRDADALRVYERALSITCEPANKDLQSKLEAARKKAVR